MTQRLTPAKSTPSSTGNIWTSPWQHHTHTSGETKLNLVLVLPGPPIFPTSMDEETDMSPDLSVIVPSDVECDTCTGRKRKAEQSCLQCLASYCENHLEMHNILHVNAKKHKLVGATGRLRECVCPEHDKLMEVFCRTDQKCICHLCFTDKHRGHDVVSIDCEVADVKVGFFLRIISQ